MHKAIKRERKLDIAEYRYDTCEPVGQLDDDGEIMDVDRESVRNLLMDSFVKNFGPRDAEIIFDYYWEKTEDLQLLSIRYGLSRERCRQVIKNVENLTYSEIKRLKYCLQ